MVAGANKVFCGTENGVCELTKDTVYVHPSAKQCNWTPGSTPIKTRTLSSSSKLLCVSDDLPMSNTLYKLTINLVNISGLSPGYSATLRTEVVAHSNSQNTGSVNIALANSVSSETYIILIMKNADGYLSYYNETRTTRFSYLYENFSHGNEIYYDITSLYIQVRSKDSNSVYWDYATIEGYSILSL